MTQKERYGAAPLDTPIPVVQRPEELIIAVIGGAGKHSAFVPTFGATRSVTRPLTCSDGQPPAPQIFSVSSERGSARHLTSPPEVGKVALTDRSTA